MRIAETFIDRMAHWIRERRDRPQLCAYGNTTIVAGVRCPEIVDPWVSKAMGHPASAPSSIMLPRQRTRSSSRMAPKDTPFEGCSMLFAGGRSVKDRVRSAAWIGVVSMAIGGVNIWIAPTAEGRAVRAWPVG
ncbi:hypothetical protein GCM10009532_15200 [Microbacterium aurantiacum]